MRRVDSPVEAGVREAFDAAPLHAPLLEEDAVDAPAGPRFCSCTCCPRCFSDGRQMPAPQEARCRRRRAFLLLVAGYICVAAAPSAADASSAPDRPSSRCEQVHC